MKKVNLKVNMELLSDTIFGSGYSIPGENDINVNKDKKGYPYIKGSTFKGLLRECAENWVAWAGKDQEVLTLLFGESGWMGSPNERRITVSSLCLEDPEDDPKIYFSERVFTSVNADGVAETGTLRTAQCVKAGVKFYGTITCADEDKYIIKNALRCIKWVGTLRNRGFGKVRFRYEEINEVYTAIDRKQASYIHYVIANVEPLIITDLHRSSNNNYETKNYIPGSTVRGVVIGQLVKNAPEYFNDNKERLLSDGVRFLDAYPTHKEFDAVLPSIKGFYEDKNGNNFTSVIAEKDFKPGLKRAKMGNFCTIGADKQIIYWSAETDGVMRIQRNLNDDSTPFRTRCMSEGQEFEGYIALEDPGMAPEIMNVFKNTLWFGADIYEGFGKCVTVKCEGIDELATEKKYGYSEENSVDGDHICMLAVSPFSMLDDKGEPCGINERELAEKLGVKDINIEVCSTSVSEYGAFNRTWGCRTPAVKMYDKGSVFRLKLGSPVDDVNNIISIQKKGLGIRRNEGFGQVMFFDPSLLEDLGKISFKDYMSKEVGEKKQSNASILRRAKYKWIMDHNNKKFENLSNSQLGMVQALCEKAKLSGDGKAMEDFFYHNIEKRGYEYSQKFRETGDFVRKVIETPLHETLSVDKEICADSFKEKMELLILLFDYMRKTEE